MVEITAHRKISSPVDRVWSIVSDLDSEPRYWKDLKAVCNISKAGNVVEREVTVGFRDLKGRQTVVLYPKKSIEVTLTEGPMKGTRIITLSPSGDNKATRMDVSWNVSLSGVPLLFRSIVRDRIVEGTEEALDRIVRAVQ